MAKGRKLTMSRSERYLGSYSYGDGHGTSVTDQPELVEEDIWSSAVEHDGAWSPPTEPCRSWNPRASAARGGRVVGGLSLAFEDPSAAVATASSSPRIVHQTRRNERGCGGGGGRQLATSAPVNVPDWSKIYRVNSVESIHESDDDKDGEDSGMVPPHEYLAKSQARRSRKIGGGGASVFEGVGRTLKGRELRRVRDAVWSQTGFYG